MVYSIFIVCKCVSYFMWLHEERSSAYPADRAEQTTSKDFCAIITHDHRAAPLSG